MCLHSFRLMVERLRERVACCKVCHFSCKKRICVRSLVQECQKGTMDDLHKSHNAFLFFYTFIWQHKILYFHRKPNGVRTECTLSKLLAVFALLFNLLLWFWIFVRIFYVKSVILQTIRHFNVHILRFRKRVFCKNSFLKQFLSQTVFCQHKKQNNWLLAMYFLRRKYVEFFTAI